MRAHPDGPETSVWLGARRNNLSPDETANMLVSAEMKLNASLMRKESRCSHFRLDYPDMDDANWQAWINIQQDATC